MKWKKTFSRLVVTSFILALFISCSTMEPSIQGGSIREGDVARLKPGMSEQEVTKILGSKPQSRLTQPDGNTEMTWTSMSGGTIFAPGKEQDKTYSILFGPDGKMIRIGPKKSF
jgi:outer membrane protein assembly factor BamE (lipoprotein component of BamABCDE complex)